MSESTITLDSRDEAILLFGSRDQYLREIRTALGMQGLVGRGDQILLRGSDEQLDQAQRVFLQLRNLLRQQGSLAAEDVKTVLEVVTQGGERIEAAPEKRDGPGGSRYVRPRTDGQARYVRAMQEHDLTLCVGPAGTGKCVAADTLVLTGEGLVPIEALAQGTAPEAYRERHTEVFGVNGPTHASHVYNGGRSPTFRIRTRHGLELEGTPEHPVLVLGVEGMPQWCPLDQVQPGSFVAVARGTSLFGRDVEVNFRYQRNRADHCSRTIILDRLDADFAYFMGLMAGDGCMRGRNRVIFTSASAELRDAFTRTLARWGLGWTTNPGRPYDMVVYSRPFKHLLLHLGLTAALAHEKQVPASILRAPREMVVAFLQGMFDTDGTVDHRDGYPSLATSSPQLARQVHLLLLNLGVVARLRRKRTSRRMEYLLDIRGEEASRFAEAVGFRLPAKAQRLRIRPRNTNLDVVPHAGKLLDAVVRQHTFSRAVHKQFGDYRIGRRTPSYAKLATLMTHFHEPHPARESLRWLLDRRFLWSEVTDVEQGEAQVYDLTVPGDHSFVAGGIVNHNTWLATAMAVSWLRQSAVKKIVLVRPAVEAGERLGYLPGDMIAKVNPYLRPLFDALGDMMEPEQVKRYMENDIIEICPLAYMRGRTLNQAAIILDEGQNTTVPQMKMFLTRMGNGSKIVVTGDITQVDLPPHTRSGLTDAMARLKNVDRIATIYLDETDIVRNPLVQQILRAYEDDRPRKRKE